jgi:hypothetical protein
MLPQDPEFVAKWGKSFKTTCPRKTAFRLLERCNGVFPRLALHRIHGTRLLALARDGQQ